MITIHIGLPRTASTYLQEKIFKNTHEERYLPTTSEGSRITRLLLSDEEDKINELISLIKKRQILKNDQNVIISAEDLSVKLKINKKTSLMESIFKKNNREFNIEKNRNYKDFLIEDAQIIHSLKIANKFYKNMTGKNLKVLLGIRNQPKLLSSEYSANIWNRLRSSQKQFSDIVNKYISSKCEFMKFDIWFLQLSKILGSQNVLIYESDAIDKKILKDIILFSGGSWKMETFKSEKVNRRNIGNNKWLIKPNKVFRNLFKSIVPSKKHAGLFKYFYRICTFFDDVLNFISFSDKHITLADNQRNQIKEMFYESNKKLLNLKKIYPQQILIREQNW